MGQRCSTAEQGQHQRDKVELVRTGSVVDLELQAGTQNAGTGGRLLVVDEGLAAIVVLNILLTPKNHGGFFDGLKESQGTNCAGFCDFDAVNLKFLDMTYGEELAFFLARTIVELGAVGKGGNKQGLFQIEPGSRLFELPDGLNAFFGQLNKTGLTVVT